MSARRWWHSPQHSVEDEQAWFAEAGLDFALDQELFDSGEVVVFRGELRREDRSSPATVIYPPAYDSGQHPLVIAPELEIGRHRAPNGALCLDHPVLGELAPMCGAEAVERAEHLWELWEEDREGLHDEEADAPDPWGNYVEYATESAIFIDLPQPPGQGGYLDLSLSSLIPLRGSLTALRQTHPGPLQLDAPPTSRALLGGARSLEGVWQRLPAPPPDPRLGPLYHWTIEHHRGLLERALRYAEGHPDSDMPALVGFVYPDEGPERDTYHDAWLFLLIRPEGTVEAPRPIALRGDEAWVRQPNLASLAECSVAILGAGALGSQIAALLARAGLGRFLLVDHDVIGAGNRVRHELDLAEVGRLKTAALADRLRRINPSCEVQERPQRLGGVGAPLLGAIQAADDQLAAEIVGADLIVNAAADPITGFHCSQLARDAATPLLHAWVGPGAWGGRVLLQRPDPEPSGCTECLGRWQQEETGGEVEVPALSEDPDPSEVLEAGCADPSFTGPGFELAAAAAAAARVAVQALAQRPGSDYPAADFDLLTLSFRAAAAAHPEAHPSRLPVHPECSICRG